MKFINYEKRIVILTTKKGIHRRDAIVMDMDDVGIEILVPRHMEGQKEYPERVYFYPWSSVEELSLEPVNA